jgi:uncharacterized protein YabE (DUF348 family)
MRTLRAIPIACGFILFSCQARSPVTIALVDGTQLRVLVTEERVASRILAQAGISMSDTDLLLFDGQPVPHDSSWNVPGSGTLQIRRAADISINGGRLRTTARTVGEALSESGISLHAADNISPPTGSVISGPVVIHYTAARELVITADGKDSRILSTASTVGATLANAGFPLVGLDYSKPGEEEPLPADGHIQVVRVSDSVVFSEKSIPFHSQFKQSADVELGQQQILQPGVPGLAVTRVRIRYEDGREVARHTEAETVIRPPQDRITVQGTKIVVKTSSINGVTIQYWLQLQMYATTYSPCESGNGSCSYGTASGMRAGKGVVAVDPGLYAYLNGQRLYIPGYGPAVIGDIGGGYIVEQNTGVSRYRWIDLGFDDNSVGDITGWVTVYFLAPAPPTIPDILK